MSQCQTCCGKGYLGLKVHETFYGPPTDRLCPDCGGKGVLNNRANSTPFPTLMTVKVGRSGSVQELIQAIRDAGCTVSIAANRVSPTLELEIEEREETLVLVRADQLGITGYYGLDSLLSSLPRHDLKPCPLEAALIARALYLNQSPGHIYVAMEYLHSPHPFIIRFTAERPTFGVPGRLWLCAKPVYPEHISASDLWLTVLA